MSRPVVFITGAARGVGRAAALRFAANGYAVAATGRTPAALDAVREQIPASVADVLTLGCDVTDRASVQQAVTTTEQTLGPIDVLINNAGISDSAPFVSGDDELWDRTIAINLTGTYNCMRAILPGMFARGRGRVINIASIAARVGYPYTAAYVASKHGVLGLTRAVALEAQSKGVTVNAICPGWIDTDMTHRSIERIAGRTGRTVEEARRAIEAMNARKRLIDPVEVADMALYLASAAGVNGEGIDIQ